MPSACFYSPAFALEGQRRAAEQVAASSATPPKNPVRLGE